MCIEYNRTPVKTYTYLPLCLCPLDEYQVHCRVVSVLILIQFLCEVGVVSIPLKETLVPQTSVVSLGRRHALFFHINLISVT